MKNKLAFATLYDYLLQLNFTVQMVEKSHYWFEHSASGTILVFRPYKPGDIVSEADLVSTCKMLDENGVLGRMEFEQWLYEATAA